jgi:hypothetical protein
MEGAYFSRRRSVRLPLLGCKARSQRMGEDRPLRNNDRCDVEAMASDGSAGVRNQPACPWRRSVQDRESWLPRDPRDIGRRGDRQKVEQSGAARDQHQVSGAGRRERIGAGVRRGVDEDDIRGRLSRRLESMRQARRRDRRDYGTIALAKVSPSRRARLGIEIYHNRRQPLDPSGHGKAHRKHRFPGAALLALEGNHFHAPVLPIAEGGLAAIKTG